MNKLFSRTNTLKGTGVSSNTLKPKEKGRILKQTEQQETHYLDFKHYRQDSHNCWHHSTTAARWDFIRLPNEF